jgi:hypothetical protein
MVRDGEVPLPGPKPPMPNPPVPAFSTPQIGPDSRTPTCCRNGGLPVHELRLVVVDRPVCETESDLLLFRSPDPGVSASESPRLLQQVGLRVSGAVRFYNKSDFAYPEPPATTTSRSWRAEAPHHRQQAEARKPHADRHPRRGRRRPGRNPRRHPWKPHPPTHARDPAWARRHTTRVREPQNPSPHPSSQDVFPGPRGNP